MLQEAAPLTKPSATSESDDDVKKNTTASTHGDRKMATTSSRTGKRTMPLKSTQVLPNCYITQKESLPYNFTKRMCANEISKMKKIAIQIIACMHSAKHGQQVAAWAGFILTTGETPSRLTTLDYYPVIMLDNYRLLSNCPITEYKYDRGTQLLALI